MSDEERKGRLSEANRRAVIGREGFITLLERYRYEYARDNCVGNSVLEIGCSSGYAMRFLKDKEYTGIDMHAPVIEYAKEQFGDIPNTQFIVSTIEDWFEANHDKKWDTIIAFEVLEHMENGKVWAQWLKEYCKCLFITAPYDELFVPNHPHHKLFNLKKEDFPGFECKYIRPDGFHDDTPEHGSGGNQELSLMIMKWTAEPDKATVISKVEGTKCKVVLGGHWCDLPDWQILNEADQDITKPLKFADNSVDCLFLEHVLEHIKFKESLGFFKEAFRVLNPGGVLRIVVPDLEKNLAFNYSRPEDREYATTWTSLAKEEFKVPEEYMDEFRVFLANYMVQEANFGHKFVWTKSLLKKALKKAGFEAVVCAVKQGTNSEYCIERHHRGLMQHASIPDGWGYTYDSESMFVEGIKSVPKKMFEVRDRIRLACIVRVYNEMGGHAQRFFTHAKDWGLDALLVLDDASTDDSAKYAQQFTPYVWIRETHYGMEREQENSEFLLKKAQEFGAEYILFMDCDEVLTRGADKVLKEAMDYMDANNMSGMTTDLYTLWRTERYRRWDMLWDCRNRFIRLWKNENLSYDIIKEGTQLHAKQAPPQVWRYWLPGNDKRLAILHYAFSSREKIVGRFQEYARIDGKRIAQYTRFLDESFLITERIPDERYPEDLIPGPEHEDFSLGFNEHMENWHILCSALGYACWHNMPVAEDGNWWYSYQETAKLKEALFNEKGRRFVFR